ncbi:MAG: NADH-quinone oxidoreductase subunit H [Planctomycetes bacterium]|jgi:NADH-quinone oxidoreductase subunit H|nr:NADH-quinone oxidoreductase subunit H [Planctomycetota bacterium]MCL4731927.1 NADH-quinone oxidoreductase subunit H [Planctomycetota bacterium]
MFLAETATSTPWQVYALNALKVVAAFGVIMNVIPLMIWLERKMAAWIQLRDGPSKVGLPRWKIFGPLAGWGMFGLLQPLADILKLMLKEDFVPRRASKVLFFIAPALVFVPIALAFAVVPFGWGFYYEGHFIRYQIIDFGVGVLFALACLSLAVHGLSLGGWASNNKYAQFGGVRAGAQLISYEAAMFMVVLAMIMTYGTLDLQQMVLAQTDTGGDYPGVWGFLKWGIFKQPLAFIIFLVCIFAETNRLPFDFPEAEAELVAGYHSEYGSMKFGLFFLGEYYGMCIQAALIVTLFLGGWTIPGLDPTAGDTLLASLAGPLIFCAKCAVVLWLYIQVRWTLPRFRFDQLMSLGWKRLIPLSLANVVVTALWLNALYR